MATADRYLKMMRALPEVTTTSIRAAPPPSGDRVFAPTSRRWRGLKSALLPFVLGAAASLYGCTESRDAYAQLRTPRAALIGGLESYISAADARVRLPRELPVRVLFESKLAVDDPRPRFDRLTLRVPGFQHVGFVGDLELRFVNDRLVSTSFCPMKYDPYLSALRATGVRLENSGDNANLPRSGVLTHIRATRGDPHDSQDRRCVDWADARLLNEIERWISRYS
jgi:hypothetical protein